MPRSPLADQVGRVLAGRYRLLSLLGRGASGHVYLASDVTLGRQVAVKLLHSALATDVAFLRRFRAEAQAAAVLSHPHVVSVFDWGEDGGEPYLVLEHLGGGSLRDLLDAGELLSPSQAAALGRDAATALAYAHRRGLIHRDIKPANLLFDDEASVRVADFGLARALAEAAWTEPVGALLGTVRYASPEQAQGRPLDGRADVYALALVLVEAVTGSVPFSADTTIGTLMARVGRQLEPPARLGPLGAVMARAMAPDPVDRLQAVDLVRSLEEVCRELPPPAPLALAPGAGGSGDDPTDLGTSRRRHGAGASSGSATAVLFDIEALERGLVGSPVLPGSRPAPGTVRASGGTPAAPGTPSAATVVLPRTEVGGPGGDGGARGEAPPRRRRRRWPWALGLVLLAALSGGGVALARVLLVPSYPVPRLGGMDPAHAAAALHAGRFVLRTDGSAWDGSVPAGRIDQQSPLPGAELRRGSVVSVVLSKGAAPRAVPSLQNEGQVEAVAKLAAAGFGHKVDTAYSETVAAGSVISYSPQGTQRYGTEVTLTVSEGPQPRTVPSFGGGTTYDQAAAALSHEQLVASRSDQFSSTVPAGTVIGTSPAAGQPATRGSTVTVAVSKGPELVAVPTDLQGATVAQAKADLSQAGLTVGNVWGPSGPRARVFAIDPSVGNMVAPGTPVNLYTL